ncbi:putative transposase [Trichonephila clavipes]|nr:putative transposase [Trichonephila clavipes]
MTRAGTTLISTLKGGYHSSESLKCSNPSTLRCVRGIRTQTRGNPSYEFTTITTKRILFSNEAHFWLNGYVNKQNCRIWSEANPQVYVETPLHPEKLTVWCALWAGGILLQKR